MLLVGRMLLGCIAAYVLLTAFSFLSELTPADRIRDVISSANSAGQLAPFGVPANDMFTECAMFDMALTRDRNPLNDVAGSGFSMPASHPCDGLRLHLAGRVDDQPPVTKYFYGPRYLFAVLASVLSLEAMRDLMLALSVIAPLLLILAFAISAPKAVKSILPIVGFMLVGFNLSNLGANVAHAPGFVLPIIGIAIVVAARDYFIPLQRRVFVYAFLAIVTLYFDILSGPLPFVLALLLVVNQYAFGAERWVRELFIVGAIFLISVLVVLAMRLGMAAYVFRQNPLTEFIRTIDIRLSSNVDNRNISSADVLDRLWEFRGVPFFGSVFAGTAFYTLGAVAWLAAVVISTRRNAQHRAEIVVAAIASSGILLWYLVLPNHTFIHVGFMGRIGGVIPAFGLSALVMAIDGLGTAAAVAAASIACVVLVGEMTRLDIVSATERRDLRIDVASCSNALAPAADGIPDIIVQITFAGPPVPTPLTSIQLIRSDPFGIFSSGPGSFPLVVLDSEGRTLSAPDRRVQATIAGATTLLVAYCDDHAGTGASSYNVHAKTILGDAESSVSIAP